jgi:hypothetical protein
MYNLEIRIYSLNLQNSEGSQNNYFAFLHTCREMQFGIWNGFPKLYLNLHATSAVKILVQSTRLTL